MTGSSIHVDRRRELDQIRELTLDPTGECRLALVLGVDKIGKTSLLSKAFEQHQTRPIAYVDLKKVREPYEVLDWITDRLEEHVAFDKYQRLQVELKPKEPVLSADKFEVTDHSSFTLINDGARYRQQVASLLADQLIADLRESTGARLLLLVDHYNECPAPLQDWLSQRLLPKLLKVVDTLVLLATENPPWGDDPPFSWLGGNPNSEPRIMELGPLHVEDVAEWMMALNINPVHADYVTRITGGMPAAISVQFVAYISSGGVGTP